MPVNKIHDEFHTLELSEPAGKIPPGYPEGIQQKILAGGLDEDPPRRAPAPVCLRFATRRIHNGKPFVHDYWEEVFLVEGDLTVGNDANGNGGTSYKPHSLTLVVRQAPTMARSSPRTAASFSKSTITTRSEPYDQGIGVAALQRTESLTPAPAASTPAICRSTVIVNSSA